MRGEQTPAAAASAQLQQPTDVVTGPHRAFCVAAAEKRQAFVRFVVGDVFRDERRV